MAPRLNSTGFFVRRSNSEMQVSIAERAQIVQFAWAQIMGDAADFADGAFDDFAGLADKIGIGISGQLSSACIRET